MIEWIGIPDQEWVGANYYQWIPFDVVPVDITTSNVSSSVSSFNFVSKNPDNNFYFDSKNPPQNYYFDSK